MWKSKSTPGHLDQGLNILQLFGPKVQAYYIPGKGFPERALILLRDCLSKIRY